MKLTQQGESEDCGAEGSSGQVQEQRGELREGGGERPTGPAVAGCGLSAVQGCTFALSTGFQSMET